MTVLVTGTAGFIGSHLTDKLLALGHDVVGIDSFDDFYSPALKERNLGAARVHPSFTLYRGDIRDGNLLSSVFRSHRIDVVAHLAARAGVRPSIEYPALYYDVNVRGTLELLQAMEQSGVRKLVFASSSSVYGNNSVPFSEAQSVDYPISPYAATKKAGELLCHTYFHLHGIETFCLRFFTVYGPRQRPEMAITKFARSIAEKNSIPLFAEGRSSRDYTYIDDIVAGTVAAIERVRGYEIINLGESAPIMLLDLLHMLEETMGMQAKYEPIKAQPGDVDATFSDISKARRILEYNPTFPLHEGLRKFVDWFWAQNATSRSTNP